MQGTSFIACFPDGENIKRVPHIDQSSQNTLITLSGICLVSGFPNTLHHLAAAIAQHTFAHLYDEWCWAAVLICMGWCLNASLAALLCIYVKIANIPYTHSRMDAQVIGSVSMHFSRW